jgi:hypothetical protein
VSSTELQESAKVSPQVPGLGRREFRAIADSGRIDAPVGWAKRSVPTLPHPRGHGAKERAFAHPTDDLLRSKSALGPTLPFVVDSFVLAERPKFIDGTRSAGVSFAKERKHKLMDCRGRHIDPKLIIIAAPNLLDTRSYVLGV